MRNGLPHAPPSTRRRFSPGSLRTAVCAAVLSAVFGGAVSCVPGETTPADGNLLARVGSAELTLQEALRQVDKDNLDRDSLAALSNVQRRWVEQQLKIQHARRIGVDRTPDYRSRLERVEEQLLIDALHEQISRNRFDELAVSEREAREFYQANRTRFQLEEPYVRLHHLTASSYSDAVAARNALLQGVPWETVADRYSRNPAFEKEYASVFSPMAFALAEYGSLNRILPSLGLREVSDIYRLEGAWHFVQLAEFLPEGEPPDMEWLLMQIRRWLELEKRRKLVHGYVRNLYLESEASNELYVRPLNPSPSPSPTITTESPAP